MKDEEIKKKKVEWIKIRGFCNDCDTISDMEVILFNPESGFCKCPKCNRRWKI